MKVQEATPDDWRVWRQLRLKALRDAPHAFGSSLSDWATADAGAWRQRLRDVPFNVIVEDGRTPVGQASGAPVDDHVELISMWVDASARGTGAAGLLIDAVCDWARARGVAEVRLCVRRSNTRAIRSYLSNGFQMDGKAEDAPVELAMTRQL